MAHQSKGTNKKFRPKLSMLQISLQARSFNFLGEKLKGLDPPSPFLKYLSSTEKIRRTGLQANCRQACFTFFSQ